MSHIIIKLTKGQNMEINKYLQDFTKLCDFCGKDRNNARFSLIMQPFVSTPPKSKSEDGTCQVAKICEICTMKIQAAMDKCKKKERGGEEE